MTQPAPYVLHGHDVSFFSGKIRPAFPQKSLWVREIMPDIREIKRRTGMSFFPVVVTPGGELWQDTSEILDRLEAAHPEPPLYPSTPVQRIVAYLIELYGDEIGILPAMHYRWSFEESVRKVAVDFSTPTGNAAGGLKFAQRMAGSLPMLGITAETVPAVEAHTRELLDALCVHLAKHRYLLGDTMSLADCGLMGPFYGHLFRDAVPRKLLYDTAFEVCAWIERTNRPPLDQTGWLPDDALAETLIPVLRVMADGVPMLIAAVEAIDAWAADHATSSEPIPRGFPGLDARYRDVRLQGAVRPYTLWMVQRSLDAYAALTPVERKAVDAALSDTEWPALLALKPKYRLTKESHRLKWE
jgi:glutathione S-transferase